MRKLSSLALAVGVAGTLIAPRAFAQQQDTGATTTVTTGGGTDAAAANTTTPPAPVVVTDSITNVLEEKGKGYYFLGVNYRVNLIPAFIINLFVDQGPNLVGTSTIGLSFDYRKDHFSIIPGVNFSDYTLSPILFLQKNKDPTDPGNWGVVQSNLKAIYATVDLLWSVPLIKTGQVDFEFGFAVGLGGVFGDLYNTWVSNTNTGGPSYPNPVNSNTPFYQCTQQAPPNGIAPGDGSLPQGCNTNNHQNATISKTGPGNGYREPNWFGSPGGSVPTIFPWLELPILGLRIKPIKELEMRLQGGFSITGFFFNFAAYYGFETPKSTPH
jgi:hypothetical protein